MELKQHGSISLPFNVFFIEVRKLTGLKFTKYHSFRVRLIEGRINKSGGSGMPLEYCEHKPFTLEMPQAKINGNILYCPVDFLFKQLKLFKQTSCLSFSCKDKNKKEGKKESKKTVEKKIPSPLVVPVFPRRTKEKSRSILFSTTGIKLHLKPLVQTAVFG